MKAKGILSISAVALLASAFAASALADPEPEDRSGRMEPYAIGLWGDLPYSDVQAQHRRAEPDRRHERAGARVHRARRRPQGRHGTPVCDADDVQRRAVRAGARLLQLAARRRPCSRRATTTGPTATARRTAASSRSSGSTTSASVFFSTPYSLGQRRLRQEVQTDAALPRRRHGCRALRREPPLDRRRRHLRDAQRPGLVQQPVRHRARPGRVRRTQRGQHRVDAGDLRDARRRGSSAAVMIIAQANPGWDLRRRRRARRCAIRRRWPRPTASPTASRTYLRGAARRGRSPSASRWPTCTATRTTSASTSRSSTRRAGGSRTSRASRPSATTRRNGNNDVHWLKVTVDPRSREVFSYQPQIVPANRVAVPAP